MCLHKSNAMINLDQEGKGDMGCKNSLEKYSCQQKTNKQKKSIWPNYAHLSTFFALLSLVGSETGKKTSPQMNEEEKQLKKALNYLLKFVTSL